MAVDFPNYDKRNNLSGGADTWDSEQAGIILSADYFSTSSSPTIPIAVYNRGAIAYNTYTLSRTITSNSTITAGNSLILYVGTSGPEAGEVTSVTDSLGNTWVKDHATRGSGRTGDFWRVQSAVAGTPVVTINTANYVTSGIVLYEVSGLEASPFDATNNTQDGVPNTAHSTTVANSTSNAIIFGGFTGDSPTTGYTAGSGFANLQIANGGDYLSSAAEAKIVTAAGTNTVDITSSLGTAGNMSAVAYKATGTVIPPEPTPTTDAEKVKSVYLGWLNRYRRSDGAIVRPTAEGNGDTTNNYAPAPDVVSEGNAYALIYAVQFNMQTEFDLAETFNYTKLDRRNYVNGAVGSNPPSNSYNLMMYHFNPVNNTAFDWAAAYDADIDRAKALLWAHARWGSGGTINYRARALAILQDLVDYGLRQSAHDSRWYMVSGTGNMAPNNQPEMNNSYLDPAAFRLFAQYDATNRAKWLSAVDSSYEIIRKTADAVLPNPAAPGNGQTTTAKLPANWVTMNFTTGEVSPLTASYRDTNYTYDAFRQINRLWYDWEWYKEPLAKARVQDAKPFFTNYWNTNNRIEAEYFHDGTVKSAYEQRIFYYAAWQTLVLDDASNTAAAAIWTNKIAPNFYKYGSYSSYYDNSVDNTNNISYYGQSWLIFDELDRTNQYKNYGQAYFKTHSTDIYKGSATPNFTKTHSTDVLKTTGTTVTSTQFFPTQSDYDAAEAADGSVNTTVDIARFRYDSHYGIKFNAVTIAKNTVIAGAYYRPSLQNYTGTGTVNGNIYMEASDNSNSYSASTNNVTSRARTSANIANPSADNPAWVANGGKGIAITALVQEVLNRTGWSAGNAMSLLLIGNGNSSNANSVTPYTWDYFSGNQRGILTIDTQTVAARSMARSHSTDVFRRVAIVPQTRSHSTSVVKRTVATRSHTTDTVKRLLATRSHTTNVLKRVNVLRSHTTDTFKRGSYVRNHTTDILKRLVRTSQHSTDVLRRKSGILAHTTSTNLRKAGLTRNHNTDVLKRGNYTRSHTTDVVKRVSSIRSHTTDVLKRVSVLRSHSTDVFKRVAPIKTHTTDVVKRKVFTRTHTTDVNKRSVLSRVHSTSVNKRQANILRSHSTDVNKRQANIVRSHTTDVSKRSNTSRLHTTDVLKRQIFVRSHSTDVLKRVLGTKTHSTNVLKRGAYLRSHITDVVKRAIGTRFHQTNIVKRGQYARTHSTDVLKRLSVAKTHSTDVVKRIALFTAHTTDTNKRKATVISHSTSVNKKQANITRSHTTDVNKRLQTSRSHSTDTLKRLLGLRSHTTSVNKRQAAIVRSHTTNTLKRGRYTLSHSTDLLKASSNTLDFYTDTFKRKAGDLYHVTDTMKRGRYDESHTTDTFLRATVTKAHTTSVNKRAVLNKSHSTSTNKRKAFSVAHTTNILKRLSTTRTHLTDVLKRGRYVRTHSTSVNKRIAGVSKFHFTDVLKRERDTRIHSTDVAMFFQRRRNYILNPSVENDISGYNTYTSSTLAQVTGGLFGDDALQVTNAGVVGGGGSAGGTQYTVGDLLPNTVYTISFYAKVISGNVQPAIYSELGTNTQNTNGYMTPADGWRRITSTITTGAGRSGGFIYLRTVGSNQPNAVWLIDGFMVEDGAIATPYFDGDSINAYWRGTPHASQSYSLSSVYYISHSTDVLKRSVGVVSHSTDTLKRKPFVKSHSTDTNKRKSGIARVHSTDIQKRVGVGKSHNTDINKRKSGIALTHTTSVNKRKAFTRTHTTDFLKRGRYVRVHTTSTNLRKSGIVVAHLTDIVKRSLQTDFHFTDVLKRKAFVKSHTTNTLKRGRYTKFSRTDVLKRKKFTLVHSTNTLKREVDVLVHSTDVQMLRKVDIAHTTDTLLRSRIKLVHSTDVHRSGSKVVRHRTDIYLKDYRGSKRVLHNGQFVRGDIYILVDGVWTQVFVYELVNGVWTKTPRVP